MTDLRAALIETIKVTAKQFPPGSDFEIGCTAIADAALLLMRDQAETELAALREALTLALTCGLPPHDVSGRRMWEQARATLAAQASKR